MRELHNRLPVYQFHVTSLFIINFESERERERKRRTQDKYNISSQKKIRGNNRGEKNNLFVELLWFYWIDVRFIMRQHCYCMCEKLYDLPWQTRREHQTFQCCILWKCSRCNSFYKQIVSILRNYILNCAWIPRISIKDNRTTKSVL